MTTHGPTTSNPRRVAAAILTAAVLAVPLGCAGGPDRPTTKEKARADWNAARGRVMLNLAEDQRQHGNLEDARKSCEDGLAMTADVAGLYLMKARLDVEKGDLREASDALAQAATLAPESAEIDYLYGIVAERWQRPDEAVARYRAAVSKDAGEAAYLLALGEALIDTGDPSAAAESIEPTLDYFESSGPLRDLLGSAYSLLGRHDEAAEMHRQAGVFATDGEDAGPRERHALALAEAGNFRVAGDLLEGLANRPELAGRASLHLALGQCRLNQGDADAAAGAFQQAARVDNTLLAAWVGLAKASLDLQDQERAAFALDRADELRPAGRDKGDVALLRGTLLLREGRPREAALAFATAAYVDPKDATATALYGRCLEQLGDAKGAERHYRRALALDASEPTAATFLHRLAGGDMTAPLP